MSFDATRIHTQTWIQLIPGQQVPATRYKILRVIIREPSISGTVAWPPRNGIPEPYSMSSTVPFHATSRLSVPGSAPPNFGDRPTVTKCRTYHFIRFFQEVLLGNSHVLIPRPAGSAKIIFRTRALGFKKLFVFCG